MVHPLVTQGAQGGNVLANLRDPLHALGGYRVDESCSLRGTKVEVEIDQTQDQRNENASL